MTAVAGTAGDMEHQDDAPLADEPQPGALPNDQPATGAEQDAGAPAGERGEEDEEPEGAGAA